jgi:hypothetical protein
VRPGELLALAVSGWLLGGASAETRFETPRRLWRAREMILTYLKTDLAERRDEILKEYGRESGLSVAEIAQLIARLPPVDPPAKKIGTRPVAMKAEAGGRRFVYQLQLPPEYRTGRSYPVLIALHQSGESGADMLERWGEQAGRHGYILAAPEWGDRLGGSDYGYTAAEHLPVLAALRDLRRHFAVDSDRVFLSGYGEGANMAYDVGLAHPDLFAGVLPISGQPRYHARFCWQNGQYLPFYCVWGERMGWADESSSNGNRQNYHQFKDWVAAGYPMLGIQYVGRGVEWFSAELPDAFDWMGRKKRANPQTALGRDGNGGFAGAEFRTMRTGENHFYWLSTDAVSPGRLNEGPREEWRWGADRAPAMVCATIAAGNQIGVRVHGLNQVTVWLARGMIDFDKPVLVRINSAIRSRGPVTPNLRTLLEDLYQRGDRQRLYVARLDFSVSGR